MSGSDSSSRELGNGDVLERAAAALRAAHDGQREGSGFTRARILASVAERRRPRLRRWLVLAPLGSALVVGSAWAQSTGSWPRVWQAVATVLPFIKAERHEPLERRHRPPAAPPARQQPAPSPTPDPAATDPAATEPTATEPTPAEHTTTEPAPAEPPRPARTRRAAPDAPAPDPELRRFRAAHELHVAGQPRAAIAAYEAYLQAYPSGRFVPEARYNSALDAIKVGELASARRLLEPFAAGVYGGYRRVEAQRLLEALPGDTAR